MYYYDDDYVCNVLPDGKPARLMTIHEIKNNKLKVLCLERYGDFDEDTGAFRTYAREYDELDSSKRTAALMPPYCTSDSEIEYYEWRDYNRCLPGGWRCWTDEPWEETDDGFIVDRQEAPWIDDNGDKVSFVRKVEHAGAA